MRGAPERTSRPTRDGEQNRSATPDEPELTDLPDRTARGHDDIGLVRGAPGLYLAVLYKLTSLAYQALLYTETIDVWPPEGRMKKGLNLLRLC